MEKNNRTDLVRIVFSENFEAINPLLENLSYNEINFLDQELSTSPLICAIGTNNPKLIELLILKGADVNFFHEILPLPLSEAIETAMNYQDYEESQNLDNAIKIILILLKYGANPHKKNAKGVTPYEFADKYFPPAIKLLDQ